MGENHVFIMYVNMYRKQFKINFNTMIPLALIGLRDWICFKLSMCIILY